MLRPRLPLLAFVSIAVGLIAPAASAALRDSDRDGLSNRFERTRSFTNPRQADTDRDGLTDGFELRTSQTSPRDRDTDGDGLSDRDERRSFGTDPRVFDTDRDGTGDGLEVLLGTNPLEPPPVTPPSDTAPPETMIGSGPSGTVASASGSFAFSSSEPGSSFECRLDAAVWSACSSPQAYSSLANGPHSFSVRARDQAGNTDPTPATRAWTVNVPPPSDTAPPETMIGSGPSGTVASASGSFAFSSSEPGSSFECRLDAAVWSACSSPQAYSSLANGPHSFSVRARDQAGNTDPTPATRAWTVSLPPSGTVTLTQVDGGPNYYGQFTNGLPTDPSYFPIGAWFRKADSQAVFDQYRDFGMNVFAGVECPECAREDLIRANGMKAFIQAGERTRFNDIGSETAGWMLGDEIDMFEGPSACPSRIDQQKASLPADGRVRYANYGKGVAQIFNFSDSQAACFVNQQDVTSLDVYWFTDPNESGRPQFEHGYGYGDMVRQLRRLDRFDSAIRPQWMFVELGPAGTGSHRAIQPAEVRSAVWHSIIGGARGILYFDHNFGPGCGGSTILGQCYAGNRLAAKTANQNIKALAPVLNSPFVTSGHSKSGDIDYMVKWHNGNFYVFAGARVAGGNATISIPCVGNATATRVGDETGQLAVSGGTLTDTFADKNAVHIYRIDGTSCGLSG